MDDACTSRLLINRLHCISISLALMWIYLTHCLLWKDIITWYLPPFVTMCDIQPLQHVFIFFSLGAVCCCSAHFNPSFEPILILSFSTVENRKLQLVFAWSSYCSSIWCPDHHYVAVAIVILWQYLISVITLWAHQYGLKSEWSFHYFIELGYFTCWVFLVFTKRMKISGKSSINCWISENKHLLTWSNCLVVLYPIMSAISLSQNLPAFLQDVNIYEDTYWRRSVKELSLRCIPFDQFF